jgi:uncharacterized membrane protein
MKVLYFEGDPNAPRYISGTLTRLGVAHELVRPGAGLPHDLSRFQAALLSDFPFRHLAEIEPLLVRAASEGGLGLLMIGGCKSFGHGGYAGTRLSALLPVESEHGDDRVNAPGGVVLAPAVAHPIVRGLDFSRPVVVCGYNRVVPRSPTTTVLVGRTIAGGPHAVHLLEARAPLLVVREGAGPQGRAAALATDLAPHWSGGLTDWGDHRIALAEDEVGDQYATFLMNLVRWVAGEQTVRLAPPSWDAMAQVPLEPPQPGLRCKRAAGRP